MGDEVLKPALIHRVEQHRRGVRAEGIRTQPAAHLLVQDLQHRGLQSRILFGFLAGGRKDQRVDEIVQQRESSAAVSAVVEIVGRADHNKHGGQVRRTQDRQRVLDLREVGPAVSSHLAVGPGLRRGPFHRVVAVFALIHVDIEGALRCVTAPAILHHDDISKLGEMARPIRGTRARLLAIRGPRDQHGEFALHRRAIAGRHVHVRRQLHPVSHGDHDVLRHNHVVLGARRIALGGKQSSRRQSPDCRPGECVESHRVHSLGSLATPSGALSPLWSAAACCRFPRARACSRCFIRFPIPASKLA